MKRTLPILVSLLLAGSAFASVDTITQSGLGFPVPQPVASLTEVAGFRDYDSLLMRHTSLTLQEDHITQTQTGTSLAGRAIYSYRFSSASANTLEGIAKPAMMIEGTIHSREWQSPECATRIFEWLALETDSDPVAKYLIENSEIVIHPIGNPDGLAQTQRFYNQTVNGGSDGGSGRDGRMRRKNMRIQGTSTLVDEDISTESDAIWGVDLNRNHEFGWPCCTSQSGITYAGNAPGSEPESQALYAAAALLDEDRIRFYIDFHSYSQFFYIMLNGQSGNESNAIRAHDVMVAAISATSGKNYDSPTYVDMTGGGSGLSTIGATDEYFSGTYDAMSYTCEIRPSFFDFSTPNGFILPEAQIDETREEILASTRAGFYFAAGPPALTDVRVYEVDGSTPTTPAVFEQVRSYNDVSGERELIDQTSGKVSAGNKYLIALSFNKPMRLDNGGSGAFFPGTTGDVLPSVVLTGLATGTNAEWVFDIEGGDFGWKNYPGDTVLVELDLTSLEDVEGTFALTVDVEDLAGVSLDADPRTVVDWSAAGWTNYENSSGTPGQIGGPDALTMLEASTTTVGDVWQLY